MSLQNRIRLSNIKGVKVDKQLDESKLILEQSKGALDWWLEILQGEYPDLTPEQLKMLAWILAQLYSGEGPAHLELQRIKDALEDVDLDALKERVKKRAKRLLDGHDGTLEEDFPEDIPAEPELEPPTFTPTPGPPSGGGFQMFPVLSHKIFDDEDLLIIEELIKENEELLNETELPQWFLNWVANTIYGEQQLSDAELLALYWEIWTLIMQQLDTIYCAPGDENCELGRERLKKRYPKPPTLDEFPELFPERPTAPKPTPTPKPSGKPGPSPSPSFPGSTPMHSPGGSKQP
jgi:hypothetical protein